MQYGSSVLLDAITDPTVLAGTVITSAALLSGFVARMADWVSRRR